MPYTPLENLVIAYSSIDKMAIVYDNQAICTLRGSELENARNVLNTVSKSMQYAAIPEFTRTAQMYAMLMHGEMEHPMALKTRSDVREKALSAIRDDLREHGTTYEADVRMSVAKAIKTPEAATDAYLKTLMDALGTDIMEQFRVVQVVKRAIAELRKSPAPDRSAWEEPLLLLDQAQARIREIGARHEKLDGHKRSLELVTKFKDIVK